MVRFPGRPDVCTDGPVELRKKSHGLTANEEEALVAAAGCAEVGPETIDGVAVAGEAAAEEPAVEADAPPAVVVVGVEADVDPDGAVAVSVVEALDDCVGGGEGSAAAVPAGEVAPEVPELPPPESACINCGRSLSASVMWLSACNG